MPTVTVEIYSDIACPWCFLGLKRFDRALAAFPGAGDVEVVFRPYQLDPAAPEEPRPHREVLAAIFGPQAAAMDARLAELGAAEGTVFAFDRVIENNSLLAHRLLWLAEREYGTGIQRALKERLLTGHFREGMDIGDRAQLVDAAASVGMDRGRAAGLLAGDEGRAEVERQIERARTLGVTAVPTFVFQGRYAVQGAQETSAFLRILERLATEAADATEAGQTAEAARAPAPGPGDACADGACAV